MLRNLSFALAAGLSVSGAHAALSAGFIDVPDNSPLVGYVTQDLMINTDSDWGTAQILATLTAGSIYQDPQGSDYAPNPALFPNFPTLEFDSYLTGNGEQPFIAGEAVDLGGDALEFSDSHIDITWLNTLSTDIGAFTIGRFTLSDDAAGTWTMKVTSTTGFRTYQGNINNGMFDLRDTGGGEPLLGDLDTDGFVGIADLNIVLGDWNNTDVDGNAPQYGDLNFDLFVGISDLNIILGNWNQTVLPGDYASGDIDGDGFVGIADLNAVLGNWNYQIPVIDPRADPSGDDFVGIEDLNLVLGNWNQGTPPSSAIVPEPGTLVCFGFFALALTARSKGRKLSLSAS
ncbi:MAG: hypothetical protein R3C45_13365 [Phycisphaerales bacterium]